MRLEGIAVVHLITSVRRQVTATGASTLRSDRVLTRWSGTVVGLIHTIRIVLTVRAVRILVVSRYKIRAGKRRVPLISGRAIHRMRANSIGAVILTGRIDIGDRVRPNVPICVEPSPETNRITLHIPSGARVIVPKVVVDQIGTGVVDMPQANSRHVF